MRFLILFFSGTGNTHYVAHYLARKIGSLPLEITIRSVEQVEAEAVPEFDLLAVGFPVYAASAPPFFQEYLHRLPHGEGRGAFAFCTKGAFAGSADRRVLQGLTAQGYVGLGSSSVLMPGTDGLAFVAKNGWMARWAQNKDFDHLASADRLADRIGAVIKELLAGKRAVELRVLDRRAGLSPANRLWRWAYEQSTAPLKQRFAADDRCTRCGLCVHICPSHNIRLEEDGVHFADRCVMCMRCVHQCPQEAIQIGRGTVSKFRYQGPKGDFHPLTAYGLGRDGEQEARENDHSGR